MSERDTAPGASWEKQSKRVRLWVFIVYYHVMTTGEIHMDELCSIQETIENVWTYFFKRHFHEGSLLQISRAAGLGNSAFFKT